MSKDGVRTRSRNRTELIDYIRGVSHFQMTMHMFGNQLIAVDGDTAAVDNYAMLTHHLEGERPWELNVNDACYVEQSTRPPMAG